jgi:hypothetical protein
VIDGFEGMEGNGPASRTPVISRPALSGNLGFDTMQAGLAAMHRLPAAASEYLLPFGARSRFL